MSYRANPDLDLQILRHRDQGHGPRSQRNAGEDASVLIDATLKEDFPPISLPKREYMERAREIWQELGLPPLKPEAPWYGYSLGDWPEELEQAAQLAVKGEYFQTGEKLVQRRRKDAGRPARRHRSPPGCGPCRRATRPWRRWRRPSGS